MSDDAGPRNAPCVSLLVNDLDAACVVNMAMGVDHAVNGASVPAPDSGKGLFCGVRFSRIYQHQSRCSADDGDAAAKVCRMDGDNVLGDGGDSPSETASVHSAIGAVPFQSRSKSWSCSILHSSAVA
jgi:hypothetical protein